MASPERGLITQLLDSEDAVDLVSEIQSHWFTDEECLAAFEIIKDHVAEYQEPLSRAFFLEDIPGFPFENYSISSRALINRIRTHHARLRMAEIGDFAAGQAKENFSDAIDTHIAELHALREETRPSDNTNVAQSMSSAVDRYHERKANKGTLGLRWMWEPLQLAMKTGAKKAGYYLLYARPKTMKTWLWLAQCVQWFYNNHVRLLVISRELTVEQLQDRIICLFAEVEHGDFLAGELTPAEEICLEEAAEAVAEIDGLFVEAVSGYGAAAAQAIAALCEKHSIGEGDVCFVDGLYFYAEESNWASLGAFSRGLADLKRERELVLMATMSANRTMTNIANSDAGSEMSMGDAPSQDVDASFKIRLDSQEEHIHIMLVEARDAKRVEFTIHAKPATNFSTKYSNAPGKNADVETSASGGVRKAPVVGGKRALGLDGKGQPKVQGGKKRVKRAR